jgi:hypothetical protein
LTPSQQVAETTAAPLSSTPHKAPKVPPPFVELLPDEEIRYQDAHIYITQQRFIAGLKAYNLSDMQDPSVRPLAVRTRVFVGLGLFALLCFFLVVVQFSYITLIIGCSCLAIMGALYRVIRPNYVLRIRLPEGETDILMSLDPNYIKRTYQALQQALEQDS